MQAATTTGKGEGLATALRGGEEEDFEGPRLGSGPVWRLQPGRGAPGVDREGEDGALFRCGALLEQALSCSELADVGFVFDDGGSGVRGHRGMLCAVSGEFRGMFGSGMVEARSGEVRVRGVGRESFRGFLELLYLGRAGKEMGLADGREVWMLADLYDVQGIKDWLMTEGLDEGSVCAAAQFALEGGLFLSGLLESCKGAASARGVPEIGEEALWGVSAEAAGVVLEAFLRIEKSGTLMVEGFKYVERWARANGGLCYGDGGVESLVGLIELGEVCPRDLMDIVRPSGLLSEGQVDAAYAERLRGGHLAGRRLGVVRSFGSELLSSEQGYIAVGSHGGGQRVAVSSYISGNHVHVFDVTTGACVFTLGTAQLPLGPGPESYLGPRGVAFNDRGELIVCVSQLDSLCVFDSAGRFVREIGGFGAGVGRLDQPRGLAVSKEGEIFVTEAGRSQVKVFLDDGTFVRAFGAYGDGDGEFNHPYDIAVGRDGRLVLADNALMSLQAVSAHGEHLMYLGLEATGLMLPPAFFHEPRRVAMSAHGEVLAVDVALDRLQVFSREGGFLRSFGAYDISGVDRFDPLAVCVDADGHVFAWNRCWDSSCTVGEILMLS